jgi:hypothetical protein
MPSALSRTMAGEKPRENRSCDGTAIGRRDIETEVP